VRKHLSFANVTSMVALFIALGGSAYAAAQLPRNSVGKAQIRPSGVGKSEVRKSAIGTSEIATNGVGSSEIKTSAIGTKEIRDGKIDVADLSPAAQAVNGVTFRTSATDQGAATGGNAKTVTRTGEGVYSVDLGTDVSKCQVAASITGTGATPGFVTVVPGASTNLLTVNTFNTIEPPVTLLVAC
jgi:hypothetical protein